MTIQTDAPVSNYQLAKIRSAIIRLSKNNGGTFSFENVTVTVEKFFDSQDITVEVGGIEYNVYFTKVSQRFSLCPFFEL